MKNTRGEQEAGNKSKLKKIRKLLLQLFILAYL